MIHPSCWIGEPPESRDYSGHGIAPHIAPSARVEALCTVDAGISQATHIGERTWLMKGCHVGHDAYVGDDCELAPHCVVGGHVLIEDRVRVGVNACFKPFVQVGAGARIGMGSVVICDVPAGEVWAGNPARCIHPSEPQMTESEAAGWDAMVEGAKTQRGPGHLHAVVTNISGVYT